MGAFFGATSHRDVVLDVFFGVDYHSHLGTKRAGMVLRDEQDGFQREIRSIENTPFRTKFEDDLATFHGTCGIGCISDTDPQPLLIRSRMGVFALTTVSAINNAEELVKACFDGGDHQFMAMSSGQVNATELTAADFADGQIGALALLVRCGLAASNGEARRLVQQGGLSVDEKKVTDAAATFPQELFSGEGVILKKGKKVFHRAFTK